MSNVATFPPLGSTSKKDHAKQWYDETLRTMAEKSCITAECYEFIAAFEYMCVGDKKNTNYGSSKTMRAAAWKSLDNNGNGHVSLAETGKWIQDHLINTMKDKEHAVAVYKKFYPVFIRAFLDAADYGDKKKVGQKGGTGAPYFGTATTDDWVQFFEFRLLCTYLCIYAVIWEAFSLIDGGGVGTTKADDRRISEKEWVDGCAKLKGAPLNSLALMAVETNPSEIFAEMDADSKGKVLLAEFCTYIENYEVKMCSKWGKLLNAGEA